MQGYLKKNKTMDQQQRQLAVKLYSTCYTVIQEVGVLAKD